MNGRVVMADVAKRAGVHVTTVSLALRNHPSLPLATRQRLQALAEEMGYQPDPALRALIHYRGRSRSLRHTPTIAYVTNWGSELGWKNDPPHEQFFAGASARAPQLGYRLEHFWLGQPGLTHPRMSDILYNRGINGVIIASHRYEDEAPLVFEWPRFSAVKIDFFPHEPALHNVTNDQRAIMQLAMRRVVAAGYRRIGFVIHESWDLGVELAWSAGFLAEQRKLPRDQHIPMLQFSHRLTRKKNDRLRQDEHAASLKAFADWMRQYRPEVVISAASLVKECFAELGLSIPRDVAFVDILLQQFDGQTAGVRQNCHRVGELAVEILAGQLQHHTYGVPPFPTVTLVEGTWFDGASLPPRVGAPPVAARPSMQQPLPA